MSDSLSATVIVIASVLMISAKPELLEDDELELPRLPAVLDEDPVPDVPEESEPDAPDPVEFELELEPAEISSPGLVLSNETIVPLAGAYSFVSASAVSALLSDSSALTTCALAEAIADGEGVVVVLVLVFAEELELGEPPVEAVVCVSEAGFEPADDDGLEPLREDGFVLVDLGVVEVDVGIVEVVVGVVEVVVGVVGVVLVVVLTGVLVGRRTVSETNSVLDESTVVFALLVDPEPELPEDPDELPSSAAFSSSFAASRLSCA